MSEINSLGGNTEAYNSVSPYPMVNVSRFSFQDTSVYQFSYEEALPSYRGMSNKYIQMIRHYYRSATQQHGFFSF